VYRPWRSVERQEHLDLVAMQLEKMAAEQDASFSGVAIDSETNTVTVYRVGGDVGQAAVYRTVQAGGASIEVRPALLTKAQRDQISARIDAEFAELGRQGIRITSYGGGAGRGGRYRIGVVNAPPNSAARSSRTAMASMGLTRSKSSKRSLPSRSHERTTLRPIGGARTSSLLA
jgi:hypothetical protein